MTAGTWAVIVLAGLAASLALAIIIGRAIETPDDWDNEQEEDRRK